MPSKKEEKVKNRNKQIWNNQKRERVFKDMESLFFEKISKLELLHKPLRR